MLGVGGAVGQLECHRIDVTGLPLLHPHLVVVPRQLLHALPRVRRPDGGQPVPATRDDLVYIIIIIIIVQYYDYVNNIAT